LAISVPNAAFTLSGFDDHLAGTMKQAFYRLHKQNIARAWQKESTFL